MTWLASILIGVLTAAAGLLASGYAAHLAVGWYRISSFEGGAGYFMVGLALLGAIAGLLIGIVTARVLAAGPDPSFLKALGVSLTTLLGAVGIITGLARFFADIPPTLNDESLFLQVEFRWPEGTTTDPRSLPGPGLLHLGSAGSASQTIRKREEGPLFTDLARQEEGRWIVPGAVPIWTGRGQPVLDVAIGDSSLGGFILPLSAHPGEKERAWSPWYPNPKPGAAPLPPEMLTYRYRVITESEPMRLDSIGPFTIETVVREFFRTANEEGLSARSTHRILHNGVPVPGSESVTTVAAVGGPVPALLVGSESAEAPSPAYLLVAEGDSVRTVTVGGIGEPMGGRRITNDEAEFRASPRGPGLRGWVDRRTFATPGLYMVNGSAILDTRSLTAVPLTFPSGPWPNRELGLLTVSPDGGSVVWYSDGDADSGPILGVTDLGSDRWYAVPIERARMRFNQPEDLGPRWIAHHFEWRRVAEGGDSLVARERFTPLPYRGELSLGKPGEYQTYTLRPAGDSLRAAVVEYLQASFGGTRAPDELNGFYQVVVVEGKPLKVSAVESGAYVSVTLEPKDGDPALIQRVAAALDSALATGKYDSLFGPPGP